MSENQILSYLDAYQAGFDFDNFNQSHKSSLLNMTQSAQAKVFPTMTNEYTETSQVQKLKLEL